jgi:hypothetical protein
MAASDLWARWRDGSINERRRVLLARRASCEQRARRHLHATAADQEGGVSDHITAEDRRILDVECTGGWATLDFCVNTKVLIRAGSVQLSILFIQIT